jgi:sugar-specific transcriptional regulator TrmB
MNIVDILRLDIKDLEHEYRNIASVLEKLGLSEYEARLFVAAVIKGHGTADDLAELSMVPRTSAYKALQALEDKGFVTSSTGRPTIYHPSDLDELRKRIMTELDETFDKLTTVKGLLSEKGTPQLVYTISGKKRVMAKIGEMMDTSKRRLLVSSPMMKEIRAEHGHRFKEALNRGVEIMIISEPLVKLPDATSVYRKNDLIATDIISDAETAMIASPGLDLCGYSDNPFIAEHLENFILMSISKKKDVV